MSYKFLKTFIVLALWGMFIIPECLANEDDKLYRIANKLLQEQKYDLAITEFKRHLYKHGTQVDLVLQQIAYSYLKIGETNNSIKHIDRAISTADNDSIRFTRIVDKAIILLSSGQRNEAKHLLIRVFYFSSNNAIKCRTAELLTYAYALDGKFLQAKGFAEDNSYLLGNCEKFEQINNLLPDMNAIAYKDPDLAKKLSTYLPGSGQIYAGSFFNGAHAFFLNSGLATWFVFNILHADYPNAIVSLFALQSFYMGNRERAYHLAVDYNENLNQLLLQPIIDNFSEEHQN